MIVEPLGVKYIGFLEVCSNVRTLQNWCSGKKLDVIFFLWQLRRAVQATYTQEPRTPHPTRLRVTFPRTLTGQFWEALTVVQTHLPLENSRILRCRKDMSSATLTWYLAGFITIPEPWGAIHRRLVNQKAKVSALHYSQCPISLVFLFCGLKSIPKGSQYGPQSCPE